MRQVKIDPNTDLNTVVKGNSTQKFDNNKWLKLLNKVKIDPKKPLRQPPVCLSIVDNEGREGTIGSLGDFSLIIGKAKSRKTFCISLFMAALTKNGAIHDRIKGKLPSDKKKVVFFDTEQSEYHVQKLLHRIIKMTGSNSDHFEAYSLRIFSPTERLHIIDTAIQTIPNLGAVGIDGVRDLVTSINDDEEASLIASYLLKWTQEKKIHIITALHQNKGDQNARGHLGSELVNKAQTVLSVYLQKDKSISLVRAEYCRDKTPDPFAFVIDQDGLPRILDGFDATIIEGLTKPNKSSPDQIEKDIHLESLNELFRENSSPKGPEVKSFLKDKFEIGANNAGKFLNYYEEQGWIKRIGDKKAPNSYFNLVLEAFNN
ncbi:AAA family ATPase [Algoriphagus taiwanensis]|uniref:AAA family ATPase n=1 Tax=Algoriphagus taiwanensis TaxID=1445656 RepID=A0ABQ6PVG3_9BACT|nr:AAA family ATPase [Algoriphagus taiwanensis]